MMIKSFQIIEDDSGITYRIQTDEIQESSELLVANDGSIYFEQSQYYRSYVFRELVNVFLSDQEEKFLAKLLIDPIRKKTFNQKQSMTQPFREYLEEIRNVKNG